MMTNVYGWTVSALLLWNSLLFAANNPNEATVGSSTGDFDIQLLIPPLAQIGFPAALTNIDFGSFDEAVGFEEKEQGFCIFHNTAAVTLVANSNRSGSDGRFVLAHASAGGNPDPEDSNGIEYRVEIYGQGAPVTEGALIEGVPTTDFSAANAKSTDVPNCSEGSANMELRLQLVSGINLDQKEIGAYNDELTLTVNAE